MIAYDQQKHVNSYYAATANPWTTQSKLSESIQTDVCVVGGGLAGLSAALNLAEQGLSVVLLESSLIGWGASGRNGGQVISGYACDIDTIKKQVGEQLAKTFWDMSTEAVRIVDERVKKHNIQCDWSLGYVHAALKPRQFESLAKWKLEAEEVYQYHGMEVWQQDKLESVLSSKRYIGGLFDPHSGHLHPLNYTQGLAQAALDAGVKIYENSAVTSIKEGTPCIVSTQLASVECRHIVLACNVYLQDLAPPTAAKIMPAGTYIIATEPLGHSRANELIQGNLAVCDTQFVLDYYRLSSDHRLLFGGKVSYSGNDPRDLKNAMRKDMLKVFPQLNDVSIDYAWGGFCDISMNRAPDLGNISPHIYYLQGFSGHGVSVTGLAGKLVAEQISGQSNRFELFKKLQHHKFPGGALFRTPALVLGMSYYKLMDLF